MDRNNREDESLDDLLEDAQETEAASAADSIGVLEDLFEEAVANSNVAKKLRRPMRAADPSIRDALDAAAKRMRELYTDPNNWKKGRGLVLIDKETKTVLGNFLEYIHCKDSKARKLIRAHEPIEINGQEEIDGWLGHAREAQLRGVSWDREVEVTCHIGLDEVQVEAPLVRVKAFLLLNTIVRAELVADTQFATASGNLILKLPAGTNVWDAAGVDTKMALRVEVMK
jgi:hypothetical protein